MARRRDRSLLDARLAEPRVDRGRLRDRRLRRAFRRRPSRPRVLGAVVPGRLGLGDARADPPVVLLAALHVGGADRPRAVPGGAGLREDARRARAGDARLVGEHDRRGGCLRPHGRRRHALAVLRAAARPEPPLRLRAGERDQEEAADAVELGAVPRRLRKHRRASRRASPTSTRRRSATPRARSTAGSSRAPSSTSPRRPRLSRIS